MGFFAYIKTWFTKKTDEMKDPAIEIEQAIQEAQKRDLDRGQQPEIVETSHEDESLSWKLRRSRWMSGRVA